MRFTKGFCLKWFLYWTFTGRGHPDHIEAARNEIRTALTRSDRE